MEPSTATGVACDGNALPPAEAAGCCACRGRQAQEIQRARANTSLVREFVKKALWSRPQVLDEVRATPAIESLLQSRFKPKLRGVGICASAQWPCRPHLVRTWRRRAATKLCVLPQTRRWGNPRQQIRTAAGS